MERAERIDMMDAMLSLIGTPSFPRTPRNCRRIGVIEKKHTVPGLCHKESDTTWVDHREDTPGKPKEAWAALEVVSTQENASGAFFEGLLWSCQGSE